MKENRIMFTFNRVSGLFDLVLSFMGIDFRLDMKGVNRKDAACIMGIVSDAQLWDFVEQMNTEVMFRTYNDDTGKSDEFFLTIDADTVERDWSLTTIIGCHQFVHHRKFAEMRGAVRAALEIISFR
jgi:hypothetical protein